MEMDCIFGHYKYIARLLSHLLSLIPNSSSRPEKQWKNLRNTRMDVPNRLHLFISNVLHTFRRRVHEEISFEIKISGSFWFLDRIEDFRKSKTNCQNSDE